MIPNLFFNSTELIYTFTNRRLIVVFSIMMQYLIFPNLGKSQPRLHSEKDSIMFTKIYSEILNRGKAYDQLSVLCKTIGHRLSGTQSAEDAVDWTYKSLGKLQLDRVSLQPTPVTVWKRGVNEWMAISEDTDLLLNILSLGGSVPTDGIIQAPVVIFEDIEALKKTSDDDVKGKIVYFSKSFDQEFINTFKAYGACLPQRSYGAVEAAKKGAVGIIIKSLTHAEDDFPHTGSVGYSEEVIKIPAVAISTNDAQILEAHIRNNEETLISMNLDCSREADNYSSNVIGEIKGKKYPNQYIVLGAHLDSWDLGEGAHDDGAGVVQCIEALRTLKALNYKPNYSIRVVLFMNEENGAKGAKTYNFRSQNARENHIAAIESDRGGFSPRGFTIDADSLPLNNFKKFISLWDDYELHYFEPGYSGVDINFLKEDNKNKVKGRNPILLGLYPDSQRYFDYHHTANDVFDNVNKRELHLGAAALTTMTYFLDNYYEYLYSKLN